MIIRTRADHHGRIGAADGEMQIGPRRHHDRDITGHAAVELQQHRGGVVDVGLDHPVDALAVDRGDGAEQIDHAVDQMNAHRRHAAGRPFGAIEAPIVGRQHQARRHRFRGLDMQDRSQGAVRQTLAQLGYRRMEAPVVADHHLNPGIIGRRNRAFGIRLGHGEGLFAVDVLAGRRRRDHLVGVG